MKYKFLGIPVSARVAGLGEAAITLSDLNAASVFTNPAGLGFYEGGHSFFAAYSPWFADVTHFGAAYAYNTGVGVVAAGADIFNYGSIERTVKLGSASYQKLGTYTAGAGAYGITFAKRLTDRFAFGLTAKYVRESIDIYAASNIVMDGGFLYYTGLGSFRIGAVIQNFGTNAKFRNGEFKMPSAFKIGAAGEVYKDASNSLTLLAEAVHPTDADERVVLGAEARLGEMVMLRGGYKFFYDLETFTAGIGIRPPLGYPLQLDFSVAGYGVLGNNFRFSLEMGL